MKTDVVVAPRFTSGVEIRGAGEAWSREERCQLGSSGGLWVGPLGHSKAVMDACEPAGQRFKPIRQYNAYYTIGRDNPPEPTAYAWDSDGLLQRAIHISRLVHPTAIGFNYAAMVVTDGEPQPQIIPFPGRDVWTVHVERQWLTRAEWEEVGRLLDRWSVSPAPAIPRIQRATRAFWKSFLEYELPDRSELLARCIEALTKPAWGTPRSADPGFVRRLQSLATDVGESLTDAESRRFWELRSLITHGASWQLPPHGTPQAQSATADIEALYVKVERALRLVLTRCLKDDAYACKFSVP